MYENQNITEPQISIGAFTEEDWSEAIAFKEDNEKTRNLRDELRRGATKFQARMDQARLDGDPLSDPYALTEHDLMAAEGSNWDDCCEQDADEEYFDSNDRFVPLIPDHDPMTEPIVNDGNNIDAWGFPIDSEAGIIDPSQEVYSAYDETEPPADEPWIMPEEQAESESDAAETVQAPETFEVPDSFPQDAPVRVKPAKDGIYRYVNHLSDNEELLESLKNDVMEGGKSIGVFSGCGSGKTYFMFCMLQKAIYPKRQLIQATPNKIQSEQNGKLSFTDEFNDVRTVTAVTSSTENKLDKNRGGATSVVYDSLFSMLKWDDQSLRRVVLVIDEAHLLFEARNYRKEALANLWILSDRIKKAGGTVIYMTGTPAKLGGMKFDRKYTCRKTNESGQFVPEMNIRNISLIIKKNKKRNMRDMIVCVAEKLIKEGKKPIFRVNNKKAIQKLQMLFTAKGYKVHTLTSREKTETSDMYRSIMREDKLPEADIYLVTSILEVGTSITAVKTAGGDMRPDNMAPVFVALEPAEMDLDMIRQFWSRLRFPIETGYVLFNHYEDKQDDLDFSPNLSKDVRYFVKNSITRMEAANSGTPGRNRARGMQDENAVFGLIKTQRGYADSEAEAYADGVSLYYRKAYLKNKYAGAMFKREFGLPVSVEVLEDIEKNLEENIVLNEDTKAAILKHAANGVNIAQVFRHLDTWYKPEEVKIVNSIMEMPGGREVLLTLEEIDPSPDMISGEDQDQYRREREALVHAAIDTYENGNSPETREIKKNGLNRAIMSLSGLDQKTALYVVNHYLDVMENMITDKSLTPDTLIGIVPNNTFRTISWLWNTEEFRDLILLARDMAFTRSNWKSVCMMKTKLDHSLCLLLNQQIYAIEWNKLTPDSERYFFEIDPVHFLTGAQYHVLRNPEMFFKDAEGNALYPDGFSGKTLSEEKCGELASMMQDAVLNTGIRDRRKRKYTGKMVRQFLTAIYSYKERNGGILILGLRKNLSPNIERACGAIPKETLASSINECVSKNVPELKKAKALTKLLRVRLLAHYDPVTARWITDNLNRTFDIAIASGNWKYGKEFDCMRIFNAADEMVKNGIFPARDESRELPFFEMIPEADYSFEEF